MVEILELKEKNMKKIKENVKNRMKIKDRTILKIGKNVRASPNIDSIGLSYCVLLKKYSEFYKELNLLKIFGYT